MINLGHNLVILFGANANNSLNTSYFTVNANNDSGNSNVNITSQNLVKNNEKLCPYQQGKIHYYTPLCVGTFGEDSGATRL